VLRAASQFEGIRIALTATLRAIPAVGDVVLVGLLFYFIFGVMAVNLLMGLMHACVDGGGGGGGLLDAGYVLPAGAEINESWWVGGRAGAWV
jgi:hypothetical protein